jgi:hypothetical protein
MHCFDTVLPLGARHIQDVRVSGVEWRALRGRVAVHQLPMSVNFSNYSEKRRTEILVRLHALGEAQQRAFVHLLFLENTGEDQF